ncbi:polyprenol monophosphomannose synthase [Elusimicrobiota bacterium]
MKTIAMIPTYNEAGNIESLVKELFELPIDIEVLVVDDFSPDGTYGIVERMKNEDKRVHLLIRKQNRGRGWAGIDGFNKALAINADYIVEMDGDGSHSPKFIPSFIEAANNADVVIGSRYITGGKDEKRSFIRQLISTFARKYLSIVLGVRISDPTSGFRMFKRASLKKITPYLKARDPFIVSEVLFYAKKLKLKVIESPIEFLKRGSGESKLQVSTLLKYLLRVWKLKFFNDFK